MGACIYRRSVLRNLHVHCPQIPEFPHVLVQAVEESAGCCYDRNPQRSFLWTVSHIRVAPVPLATFPSQHNLGDFPHFSSLAFEAQSLEGRELETAQPRWLNSCVVA
jgi:hypothetical protein